MVSWYFVGIEKSKRRDKKLVAIFESSTGRIKNVNFGAAGMSDYTIHKDRLRKQRYLDRHSKNEHWNNPLTPGSLSRWVLWNKPSLKTSIADYKRQFFPRGQPFNL